VKKLIAIVVAVVLLLAMTAPVMAGQPEKCTTIKDGGLVDSLGNPLVLGYDQWGYNYQAHMFNGWYENSGRPTTPVTESDTWLQMKWNDAWLSNKDCDGDGKLDRHYGFPSYIGSGAWLTNHQWDENEDGSQWNYFVKIVAVPADAHRIGLANTGTWYTADDTEIGPDIWGEFAVIQEVYNDPYEGSQGIAYLSPSGPGLGKWKP